MTVFELFPDFGSAKSVAMYFAAMGIHALIFLVALAFLNYFIFIPATSSIRLRKRNLDEAEKQIRDTALKCDTLKEELLWRLEGAEQLAEEKKEVAGLIGRCRADMLLLDVRRETNRDLDNVVKSVETAYAAVAPTVKKDISYYAEEIATKILNEQEIYG